MKIRTKPSSTEYKEGWDRIYGKKSTEPVDCDQNVWCDVSFPCWNDSNKCIREQLKTDASGTNNPTATSSQKNV